MYLTISQCDKLDVICNRFEVALRSYTADIITQNVNKVVFGSTLKNIASGFSAKSKVVPINAAKYQNKASSLLGLNIYKVIESSKTSYLNKDVVETDVLTVGQLIDLILLLYNPMFINLGNKFGSLEEFVSYIVLYHKIRNNLAHPASAKIIKSDTEKILFFIKQLFTAIDEEYFWFNSKIEINNLIASLINDLSQSISIKNNLDQVPKRHKELLLRHDEMNQLLKLICGEGPIARVSGSVELYGYGGVGKTALAAELCYEIVRKVLNDEIPAYSFILWLSAKKEELSYNLTGEITIKKINPDRISSEEITLKIKNLLGLPEDMSETELMQFLTNEKGLIILDNLETVNIKEKGEIRSTIKKFPRSIQFLITSRNYEELAEDNKEIKGFSDLNEGKKFIESYCLLSEYQESFENELMNLFIKNSCGNTLILVLGLERIIDGTASMGTIIDELQIHGDREIELIVDFMYKNTFDSAINEIENKNENINIKQLLTVMLLYQEAIDFHSLRELINYDDSKTLEEILIQLNKKFVIIRNRGYYELHDFAEKFIVLKFLPDQTQLRILKQSINLYKQNLKNQLQRLYEDKRNYEKLRPILNDWKVITETETIAIAIAYSEYEKVKDFLYKNNKKEIKILEFLNKQKMN